MGELQADQKVQDSDYVFTGYTFKRFHDTEERKIPYSRLVDSFSSMPCPQNLVAQRVVLPTRWDRRSQEMGLGHRLRSRSLGLINVWSEEAGVIHRFCLIRRSLLSLFFQH